MLTPNRPPPEDYYQNNCRELFVFTLERYEDLLPHDVKASVVAFLTASDGAQRLFARLLTRKGPYIRVDSLEYAEITNCGEALAELGASGLITVNAQAPGDDLLDMLRKDEIAAIWPNVNRSVRKSELQKAILGTCTDGQIRRRIETVVSWVCIDSPSTWDLLRLLYFGSESQDWAAFVLRDLGMTRFEKVSLDSRQFADKESLALYLHYQTLSHFAQRLSDHPRLAAFLVRALEAPQPASRQAERRRSAALLEVARWCERQERYDDALRAYEAVRRHPARERTMRILAKLGRSETCEALRAQIKRAPFCEEEAQFAERFGKRNAGHQPPTTVVDVAEPPVAVEAEALNLLLADGGWGIHVESSLVRTLTGLIYWRAVFAPVAGAFTNPFQLGPNDLFAEDFIDVRRPVIDAIEAATADDTGFVEMLDETAHAKYGITNALVDWRIFENAPLEAIVAAMPVGDMRRLTRFYIRNLKERRSGLPDLFVAYGPGDYEFVEVKGPNDQLQPGQRVWLRHLAQLQIPARVLKLRLVS